MTPLFQTQVRPGMLLCAFLCVLVCVVSTTVEKYYGAIFSGSLAVIFFIMSCQRKPIASEPIGVHSTHPADVSVTSAITHCTARQPQPQQQQHFTQQLYSTQPPSYSTQATTYTSQASGAAHPLYPTHNHPNHTVPYVQEGSLSDLRAPPPSPHNYPHEATLPANGQQLSIYGAYALDPAYGAYTRSSIVFQSSTDGLPTYEEATTTNLSSDKSAKKYNT